MRKKNSQVGIFYEYYYSEILRKNLLKLNFMKEKKLIENKEEKTNKKMKAKFLLSFSWKTSGSGKNEGF